MPRKKFFAPKRCKGSSCSQCICTPTEPSASTKRIALQTNSDDVLKLKLKSRSEVCVILSSVNEEVEDGERVVMALTPQGAAVMVPWNNIDWIETNACLE